MEPWEALDVDDSDFPSLLRPCKRHHRQQTVTHRTTTSPSQPILEPCSHSQTLNSLSPQFDSVPPPTPSPRLIPGPAGAVRAGMIRKARDDRNFSCRGDDDGEENPIPTQEYIRRAVEDAEEDNDFKCNPWLCAVEFLRREGTVGGVLPSTPLSSVKKCLNIGKVDQVVAVIKSCAPNGLGDLMVTLKDPTGTVGATIHRKVLSEGEFGKDITVGSVLILQKVAVFAPSGRAHYLNITLSNVAKVICKDSGPPLQQIYPPSAVKYAAPGTECRQKTGMLQRAFSLEQRRTDGIMNEIRQNAKARGSSYNCNQRELGNSLPGSSHCSNGSSLSQIAAADEEPSLVRQDATNEIYREAVRMETNDDDLVNLNDNDRLLKGGYQSGSHQHCSAAANSFENNSGQEVQNQRQPLISRPSLPQWTDEQLKELFAADCEDDDSLF